MQRIFITSCTFVEYLSFFVNPFIIFELNISFNIFTKRVCAFCVARRKKISDHAFYVESRQSIRKEQPTVFGQFSGRSQRENRRACTSQSAKCIERVLS